MISLDAIRPYLYPHTKIIKTKGFEFHFRDRDPSSIEKGNCNSILKAIGDANIDELKKALSIPLADTNKIAYVKGGKVRVFKPLMPLSIVVMNNEKGMFELLLPLASSYTLSIHLQSFWSASADPYHGYNKRIFEHITENMDALALEDAIENTGGHRRQALITQYQELFQEAKKRFDFVHVHVTVNAVAQIVIDYLCLPLKNN